MSEDRIGLRGVLTTVLALQFLSETIFPASSCLRKKKNEI
jgi:hypothetical protein